VENEEQLSHLKTLQCDAFQGNLHGAAIAATEIQGFLDKSKTIVVSEGKLFEPAPEIEIVSAATAQSEWFEPSTSVATTPSAPSSNAPRNARSRIACPPCPSVSNE
jgi:hypothetical protein